MDRTKLKNYAPQARREFIEAMTERAAFYGLTANKTEPIVEKGDVAVIGGRSFPIAVARKRKSLEDRIKRHGFQQTMEAMAYTWFNRLVAIRYMELHGYLDHGYRVLSHPDGKPTPEILEHAEHVDFPGLKKDRVIDLKLASNKEGELYRLLLTAQCNSLHSALPFLFERIDDETELLLPDNLLNSNSLIRKLVNEIDDSDWQEVEIIGWLYQFYISERKDEVIGKVVSSEDIPAATQLFTPNWIVKYLVQNTLGRQWLAIYPESPLRQQMEYYVEPAEQTLEVQNHLKEITPTSLNPEELTLLDPAVGSGHILVEAYDIFKAIYQERGYSAKDIPALVLQKNLFGVDIDDRAAQLAAFALMMKARSDDRRIFNSKIKPNIVAIRGSVGGQKQAEEIAYSLCGDDPEDADLKAAICELHAIFENGKVFGSLNRIPQKLLTMLPEIENRIDNSAVQGDLAYTSSQDLKPLIEQARVLAGNYHAVVANPPYMGNNAMNEQVRSFLSANYPNFKLDLYAAFVKRSFGLCKPNGLFGLIVMHSWMFVLKFEDMRKEILSKKCLIHLLHLGPRAFDEISGEVVQAIAFVSYNYSLKGYITKAHRIVRHVGYEKEKEFRNSINVSIALDQESFLKLPGSILCYWASENEMRALTEGPFVSSYGNARHGMVTSDNSRFLRFWWEVDYSRIGFGYESRKVASMSGRKWFPYNKGGTYRKWYGNCELVVNWENDGQEIFQLARDLYKSPTRKIPSLEFYFKDGLTWSALSSDNISMRRNGDGFLFDSKGSSAFFSTIEQTQFFLGYLNSRIAARFLNLLCPTMDYNAGSIGKVPVPQLRPEDARVVGRNTEEIWRNAKKQWDSKETSWDFQESDVLGFDSLEKQFQKSRTISIDRSSGQLDLIKSNEAFFCDALGVQQQDLPPIDSRDLCSSPKCANEVVLDIISYAIGCMMGRYSLNKPGLTYAHSGNHGFDPSQYKIFRADDDGIIPLLETDWGIRDDATDRMVEFIAAAWPLEFLEENLKFVASSLGSNSGEQPRDTIRKYLVTAFYKHHLTMYKKRPIYWLFSSGKQRAFQCLVYLHRYNEGTLARMRIEYVIPLQGQIAARIEQLEGDKAKATSTSHRNKIQKEQDKLKKQQSELATFEEKLKHYADMRISLDLDDGVKVNYAKFGDLLAESKAITGGKDDE
jgi:hypothetical protein